MVEIVDNRPVAIQVSGVKKMYKLGQIGGGTLQADLQSWWAKKRGKEDPNSIIGEGERSRGDTFMALNGIDLTIYQGEAVGIIGSNGAGKSTLLKLLSRVTAPTEGEIDIYGRIASMLEVGTGFNGELTGRENIYMNGTILGMTKSEIDAKMEQIIEFSEVREFIDTPVKRYSSGMYVKLAFSVAAHLDSEIMIMDEVLAVGDMTFQKKCLSKMREAAKQDGRTVLYVSHNMNTIRQLCDRCIVLEKGKVVFEGEIEEGITTYLATRNYRESIIDLDKIPRNPIFDSGIARMCKLEIKSDTNVFEINNKIKGILTVNVFENFEDFIFKITLSNNEQAVITYEAEIKNAFFENKQIKLSFVMDLEGLAPATYTTKLVLCKRDELGSELFFDVVIDSYLFKIVESVGFQSNKKWNTMYSGYFIGKELSVHCD